MSKIFLCMSLIFLLSTYIFSIEIELVKSFDNGNRDDELLLGTGYAEPDDIIAPNGILFTETGQLIIVDTWNKRIVYYDKDFNFLQKYIVSLGTIKLLGHHFIRVKDGILTTYMFDRYSLVSHSGESLFYYSFQLHSLRSVINRSLELVVYNGYFFKKTIDNRIFCIIPSKEFDNEDMSNILWDEDVYAMFDEDSEYDLEGLTIDENGVFFLNGELYTQNYKVFVTYRINNYENYGKDSRHLKHVIGPNQTGVYYMGKDRDNNWYWDIWGTIIIYSHEGFVIERFDYDRAYSSVIPTVSPDGDIYFLKSSPEDHKLYRIKRTW